MTSSILTPADDQSYVYKIVAKNSIGETVQQQQVVRSGMLILFVQNVEFNENANIFF